jgi:N-acetylglucosamine-6-phosphate deacetylase
LAKIKGPDKLVLVTDCMCAGGCQDGEYALGGQKVIVKDGAARLVSGELAGSILPLNVALKNMMRYGNVPIETAIAYVTLNPATLIHVEKDKGSLAVGKDADITVFDENIHICHTIGRGQTIYC